jgi:quercetin dioxygenase-like cupin family protein
MNTIVRVIPLLLTLVSLGTWTPSIVFAQIDPRCHPVSQRQGEFGCYIVAHLQVHALPQGPLFWHLDTFATRAAADAAVIPTGTVVEAHGKVWLLTVAPEDWRAPDGSRVAQIGPLPIAPAKEYGLRFIETAFPPGITVPTHQHSGPEAFYVLAGEQCVETPAGVTRTRAGETAWLPGALPMSLRMTGSETRRALALILHDGTQRATSPADNWKPSGLCQ